MARTFVAASSQKLEAATAVATAVPITMACWFKPSNTAGGTSKTLIALDDGATASSLLMLRSVGAGGQAVALAQNGGTFGFSTSAGSPTNGTWAHFGAVFSSTSSRTAYLNGVAATPETTAVTPSGISKTHIGVVWVSTQFADGDIGEAAIWNVALTAADFASLALGVSPLLIRPDALLAYWPLIGNTSPEIELRGRVELTVTGATASAHPRMFYPVGPLTTFTHYVAPTGFRLTVGGTDRSNNFDREDFEILDDLNELPNTCSFVCFGFTPVEGQIVRVTNGTVKEFEGTITTVTEYHDKLTARTEFRVGCTDYTRDFDALLATKAYGTLSGSAIAEDIGLNFAPGFTRNNVVAGLPMVDAIQFKMTPPSSALRQLCDAIGGDAYVDYDRDVHVFLTETDVVPDTLQGSNSDWRNFKYATDASRVMNRPFVEGLGTASLAEVAAGEQILPVVDASPFSEAGGMIMTGDQIVSYTGLNEGGGGSLVGPGGTPSSGPHATALEAAGIDAGVHQWAYTFVSAAGESTPSPVAALTLGTFAMEAADPHIVTTGTTGGSLTPGFGYYSYSFTYLVSAGHETLPAHIPNLAVIAPAENAINITNIPVPPHTSASTKQIYRTTLQPSSAAASAAQHYGPLYTLLAAVTTQLDTISDAAALATANEPTTNTATYTTGQAALTGIAIGPTGTTSRRIYRTAAGGSQLKLVATIANNTATTYTDSTADASLGANAPTVDASGLSATSGQVNAGSTSVLTASAAAFSASGGWAIVGNGRQAIRYTGLSGASLTGVPASGPGSIAASVSYNSSITAAPALTGIATSGAGSIVDTIAEGDEINLLVQRDDTASQAVYGVRAGYIQDRRLSLASAEVRGDAELALRKDPEISGSFITGDTKVRTGRQVTISMASAWGISGTFTITKVRAYFDAGRTQLQREVTFASNGGSSDLYRMIRQIRQGQLQQ